MIELPTKGTPFQSSRGDARIDTIVIHDTASKTAQSALNWFADASRAPALGSSAHVVIDRDGTIYRVVSDDSAAWHAGVSSLHGESGLNRRSLGVEVVDVDGGDGGASITYTHEQLDSVVAWTAAKAAQYGVPLNRIVGHDMIARGRKSDPGADFPWRQFLLRVAREILDTHGGLQSGG